MRSRSGDRCRPGTDPAVVLSSVKMRELAMNALVWDQESATIKMFCLMSINDVNTNFAARLIGLPAMLQNPMAHVLLERLASQCGGSPAVSSHAHAGRPGIRTIFARSPAW